MNTNLAFPRQVMRNAMAEIQHLMASDTLAAWDMADQYAAEICDAISHGRADIREAIQQEGATPLGIGLEALRAIAAYDINSPEEDAAMDELADELDRIESQAREANTMSHLSKDPFYHPIFNSIAPHKEAL